MSHSKRRIEALELDTGVGRGELPVDTVFRKPCAAPAAVAIGRHYRCASMVAPPCRRLSIADHALERSLERDHPGAAASIREGLEETLMVQRLGLTGALERTLRTTNIIENLMGSVEAYTRRVKRWRGGQMIQRWVASALVEAEPRFRRVRGYRDLRYLVAALDALAPPDGAVC